MIPYVRSERLLEMKVCFLAWLVEEQKWISFFGGLGGKMILCISF